MNKICIFAKNPETYFLRRLRDLLGKRLEFFNPWMDQVLPQDCSMVLVRTTGVYGDDRDLELLQKLSHLKILNNYPSLELFRSKDNQYRYFEKQSIPHLPWLDLSQNNLREVEDFFSALKEEKILVKPLRGQGGWGIEVFDRNGFTLWWEERIKKQDYSYLMQPYIEKAHECRVFFMKDDFFVSLKRIPQDKVAANFTQEGEAYLCETPETLKEIIRHLIKETGLSYGALDCLFYQNQWIVLEVNAAPGVEQLEKVSGLPIIEEFIQRLLTP